MGALTHIAGLMVLIIAVGIFASYCAQDERRLKRAAALAFIAILLTLAFAVVRGDLFRYAPGAQEMDSDSGGSFR